jgi:hypothetical protein
MTLEKASKGSVKNPITGLSATQRRNRQRTAALRRKADEAARTAQDLDVDETDLSGHLRATRLEASDHTLPLSGKTGTPEQIVDGLLPRPGAGETTERATTGNIQLDRLVERTNRREELEKMNGSESSTLGLYKGQKAPREREDVTKRSLPDERIREALRAVETPLNARTHERTGRRWLDWQYRLESGRTRSGHRRQNASLASGTTACTLDGQATRA